METTITIRRTTQPAPYESITVELSETYNVKDEDALNKKYKRLSEKVDSFLKHEKRRYKSDSSKTVKG